MAKDAGSWEFLLLLENYPVPDFETSASKNVADGSYMLSYLLVSVLNPYTHSKSHTATHFEQKNVLLNYVFFSRLIRNVITDGTKLMITIKLNQNPNAYTNKRKILISFDWLDSFFRLFHKILYLKLKIKPNIKKELPNARKNIVINVHL